MHLTVSNNVLIYRQFSNRDVKLPISNMTEKIYDYDAKTVKITTTINNLPRIFYFQFSEITRPVFATFNAMVLWFDENVILAGGTTSVSHNALTDRNGDSLFQHITQSEKTDLLNIYINIDGGSPETVYLPHQKIDGGTI